MKFTFGYVLCAGGKMISPKSQNQIVMAGSSVEAKYRVMALVTSKLMAKQLLIVSKFEGCLCVLLVYSKL